MNSREFIFSIRGTSSASRWTRRRSARSSGSTGGVLPKNVFVNSRVCTYRENARCVPRFTEDPVLCFDVPAYPERDALVEIVADKPLRVTHLDLQVRQPQPPGATRTGVPQ